MERKQLALTWVPAGIAASLAASPAGAAFLSGDALDTAADWLALFVIFVVPCVVIVLFWIVHVLPEKIAHKRHHPQRDAIQTLCLLSLVFGGLLWPIAWLWAFTKPVGYRVAYGTDKHEDYYDEMAEKHRAGTLLREEAFHLREELEAMEANGALPPKLRALKEELERLRLADAAERGAAGRGQGRAGVMEAHPPRHLLVLRLADLHQAEVAAVEHGDAGHRRDHSDRRDRRADPAAQHLRAVVDRRARLQVHGADRLAGQGPRDRGAGRGRQPSW